MAAKFLTIFKHLKGVLEKKKLTYKILKERVFELPWII